MKQHRYKKQDGVWVEVHSPSFGLGDAVAFVAQPIARMIDSVAGTKIANCAGCAERRVALNRFGQIFTRHPPS